MGKGSFERNRLRIIITDKCQSDEPSSYILNKEERVPLTTSKFTRLRSSGGTSQKLILIATVLVVSGCHQTVYASLERGEIQGVPETRDGVDFPILVKKPEQKAPERMPCGTVRTLERNEEVLIESPNYSESKNYPNSLACEWKFQFPSRRAKLTCPSFHLTEFLCFDHLDIYAANGGVMNRFCGNQGPNQLILAEEATIKFTTSAYFGNMGFQCTLVEFDDEVDEVPPSLIEPPSRCTCGIGIKDKKVVGGVETEVLEFPWQAGLVRKNGTVPFCGGTLINDRYVLTAAHCVIGRTPYNFEIILNSHNTQVGSEEKTTLRRIVNLIIPHKKYTSRLDYDAALIRIDPPVDLTAGVIVPVCLPTDANLNNSYTGINSTVSGWGLTEENGNLSPVLRKAFVETMTNEECSTKYTSITDRMICAAADGMDACQGDSGGSLIYMSSVQKQKYTQIGIVSWGIGCARPNKPGVYTRVTEIMKWIKTTTADGSLCDESILQFIGSA